MSKTITFTPEAFACATVAQLEKLQCLNSRFDGASELKVSVDYTIGDKEAETHWLLGIFTYLPRLTQGGNGPEATQVPPYVLGIAPNGDSHS